VKLDSSGIGNLSFNSILALGFEWGIRLQPREFSGIFKGRWEREITLMRAGRVFEDDAAFGAADIAVTETAT
jgi:NADPH-dependent stearoyl-CoA 9-desaturase